MQMRFVILSLFNEYDETPLHPTCCVYPAFGERASMFNIGQVFDRGQWWPLWSLTAGHNAVSGERLRMTRLAHPSGQADWTVGPTAQHAKHFVVTALIRPALWLPQLCPRSAAVAFVEAQRLLSHPHLASLLHQCYSSEVDSRQNYLRVHASNLTEFVSASVTQHFCSVILKSLDLRHVNDDSNTN